MSNPAGIARHLALSTISFALCFAMWGLVGAFGPLFQEMFQLSGTQAAFLVVLPVLLGSLSRLPMGMLTDRFGGRIVFAGLLLFVSLSALISGIIFAACAVLFLFIRRIDATVKTTR